MKKVMKPKIDVQAICPELHPKTNPEDKELLEQFYHAIDTRLIGIEHDLEAAKCKGLNIDIKPVEVEEEDKDDN